MSHRNLSCLTLSILCAVLGFSTLTTARTLNLAPPGDRAFIQDQAYIIQPADRDEMVAICDQLLSDTIIPIIVVTIDSMAAHGGNGMSIESFAQNLFDQWGIGYTDIRGSSWNRGVLLVVSIQDRKARIELGADWAHDFDGTCQRIMDEQIIPNFKQGDFSSGILAGVKALNNMSRGLELPKPVQPWWLYPALAGGILLVIFTVVSLIRRGASGWAWLFWGALFGLVGFILFQMLTSRGGSSGGFGGGSFGGGFSGGGGATGSW